LTLGTLSIAAGNLTTINTGALNLGTGTVGGNLSATSNGGAIAQAAGGLMVTGTSNINAGANTITLTDAANDFTGAVTLSNTGANAIQIKDNNLLQLATVTTANSFTANSVGTSVTGTVTGGTGVTINAGTGILTNNGTIRNGVVTTNTSAIDLTADGMVLSGAIEANAGAVSLKASSAARVVGIGSAVSGGLDLDQAALNTVSTTGGLTVGGSDTHTALVTVGALTTPIGVTNGGFTISNGGNVNLTGSVVYNATSATTNNLTIRSATANITGSGELLNTTGGAGNIILTAFNNIGVDDNGTPNNLVDDIINRINIGSNVSGVVLKTTDLATNSVANGGGKIYIDKAGSLNIVEVTNISNDNSALYTRSLTDIVTTGSVTQTGAIIMGDHGDLVIKTLNNPGASIILTNPANDVGAIDLRSRNAVDTVKAAGQLVFFDSDGYSVVQAEGGGIDFSSNDQITLSTLTLGSPASLNIDAGAGDITLSTTGNIVIEGPGKLLANNITLNLANNVTFSGGVSGANYVATQNNDLLVKATGDITIDADVFTIVGGKATGINGAPIDPITGKPLLTSNSIIEAGRKLTIETASDFNVIGGGSQISGVVGGGLGGVDFAPLANGTQAQANAFITADTLDIKVHGDFYMTGGVVTHTGTDVTGSASAIIQANNGKNIEVEGSLIITGGIVGAGGTDMSNAFAVLDPVSTLNVKVGENLIIQAGQALGPGVASASIVNSGEIKLDVGQGFAPGVAGNIVIGGKSYKEGIILIGGAGSGRFDFNDNALTENGYPISWTLHRGAEFTIDTTAGIGFGDAYIQSLAPRGVDSSLYGYLLFTIDREATGKSDRASSDQGNFTRTEVGSCN
jgi:predicted regulator of Ras-like GTPase activity (Roadblock/LC7/MglB family)